MYLNLISTQKLSHSVTLPTKLYYHIRKRYFKNCLRRRHNDRAEREFNELLWKLGLRYKTLNMSHLDYAIHPCKYQELQKIGFDFECFASIFNVMLRKYCSPFGKDEIKFGSSGTFFNLNMQHGCYVINPPFIPSLMKSVVKKILGEFESGSDAVMLLILPVWDHEGLVELSKSHKIYISDKNVKFEPWTMLRHSSYVKWSNIFHKKEFTFYSHKNIGRSEWHDETFREKSFANVRAILLSANELDDDFVEQVTVIMEKNKYESVFEYTLNAST